MLELMMRQDTRREDGFAEQIYITCCNNYYKSTRHLQFLSVFFTLRG